MTPEEGPSYPEPVQLRCLIVDDSAVFLEAATTLLEQEGIRVVRAVSSAAEAVRAARELRPDVTLVDIELGADCGFAVARDLAAAPEAAPVILISTHEQEEVADPIDDSPAIGFVPKAALSADAIRALLEAAGHSSRR
jgi:DNA-binding NarL/FixJ family response regulator